MAGDAVTKMQEELTDLKPKLLVAVDEAGKMAVIIDKEVKEVFEPKRSSSPRRRPLCPRWPRARSR